MQVNIPVILATIFAAGSILLACSQQAESTQEAQPTVQPENAPTGHDLPFIRVGSNVFRVQMGDNEGLFLIQTGCVVTDIAAHESLMTYVCEPGSVQGWI